MDWLLRSPSSPHSRSSDYLLLGAVSCLWLFSAAIAVPRAVATRAWLDLGLFGVGSAAFLAISGGVFRTWYARRGVLHYFAHQSAALALAVFSLRTAGPVWLLVLPASCQAVLVLPWRMLCIMLAVHLGIAAANVIEVSAGQLTLVTTNMLSSLLFTIGCSYVIRRERDSRAQLAAANEKLKQYAEQVQALATAEERNRLAQEIHDGAAHHLTAANMLVAAGIAVLPAEATSEAADKLHKAQGQIRAAIAELRSAIAGRFESEPKRPLVERIQRLIQEGTVIVEFEVVGATESPALRPETEHALYRVAQESLTNASKHAPGARVALKLDLSANDTARLSAENVESATTDDGDGAVGLLSLRDRIEKLGGRFEAGLDRQRGCFVVRAEVAK